VLRILIISFFAIASTVPSWAQLVLNEACAKNNSVLFDESGDTPDWIELFNGGTSTIDLNGYFLSDDPAEPTKWSFPSLLLEPDSFLIVFGSGRDTVGTELHSSFKLSRSGETIVLTNPNGFEVSRSVMPYLEADHSYGAWPDGENTFYFGEPTPRESNTNVLAFKGYTPQPFVSERSGFHDDSINVELSNLQNNVQIRYALNGDLPDTGSTLYGAPIPIGQTQTLRAKAFGDSLLPSTMVTNTYMINSPTHLPVLAVSTPPENLWDSIIGIYVFGTDYDTAFPYFGANFWDDREIPVHVEYFEENGDLGFKQDVVMKMLGWISARTEPQRPFRLHARKKYGDGDIDYPIFKDRPYDSYKRVIVRNSGGDFNRAHFRDGLQHNVAIWDELHVDAQAYQPVVVYLNGAYWGIMNFRERIDKFYFESRYDVDPEGIDLLEQDTVADEGDLLAYQAMYQFMTSNDLSIPANFEQASEMIDLQNMADYFIIETYVNNTDWPLSNLKMWRPRTPDGKWRFILVDLDATLGIDGWVYPYTDNLGRILNDVAPNSSHVQILKSLFENNGFREYFINRYADLMNTSYRTENFIADMIKTKELIEPELDRHFEVWGSNSVGFWNDYHINDLIVPEIEERPFWARKYVNDNFELNGQVELQLNVFPENAGIIRLNTITLEEKDLPWDGIYYNGVPVEITVVPNPGFEFKYWRSLHTIDRDSDQSIKYNFEVDDDIVAYFEGNSEGMQFTTYPNPSSGLIKMHFYLERIEEISFAVFDATGKQVRKTGSRRFNAGINIEPFDLNGLGAGVYTIQLIGNSSVANAKVVIR